MQASQHFVPGQPDGRQTDAGQAVLEDEYRYIRQRRNRADKGDQNKDADGRDAAESGPPNQLTGLALSGGGIRSASFCLGVMQQLAADGWMRRVDYLSTVSGGGYIGSTLTWLLSGHAGGGPFGLSAGDFPFGTGDKRTTAKQSALCFGLRQHANYLVPGKGLNMASLIGVVLGNAAVTVAIYFPWLCFFYLLLLTPERLFGVPVAALGWGLVATGLAAAALMVVISVGLYAPASMWFRTKLDHERGLSLRRLWAVTMGALLMIALALLLVGSVPLTVQALHDRSLWTSLAGLGAAVSGAIPAAASFRRSRGSRVASSLTHTAVTGLGALLLLYGLLLLAYLTDRGATSGHLAWCRVPWWWWLGLVVSVAVGRLADMNSVSLHRYYRDRLMGTFMPVPAPAPQTATRVPNRRSPSGAAPTIKNPDSARLHDMLSASLAGPYPLINTNVVLVDAESPRCRGRGGDNFILSPFYCGSSATGWHNTRYFMGGTITLASAMATSGAALNPDAGGDGRGPLRDRALSLLLRFYNVRLGYWVPNPNCGLTRLVRTRRSNRHVPPTVCRGRRLVGCQRPKFLSFPGLPALFSLGFSESSRFLELTDGGHFDNTALYELIRRRCRCIIAVDGSADPAYRFADLANLIERVRVDFGAEIAMTGEDLVPLMPGSSTDTGVLHATVAAKPWVQATITYADDSQGCLVYLTTTFTSELSADLFGYKRAHAAFPDQPTTDQFFDEPQFEAYRQLGVELTRQMRSALGRDPCAPESRESPPPAY